MFLCRDGGFFGTAGEVGGNRDDDGGIRVPNVPFGSLEAFAREPEAGEALERLRQNPEPLMKPKE